MTNGEKIQQDFECEVCEPIIEDNIIHVIFAEKAYSAIGFDLDWWNAEYKEPTTKNNFAQERYQDLIDYFGDKESAKTILEDRKEFKAWLERLRWYVKRADELARELEQLKATTKNDLALINTWGLDEEIRCTMCTNSMKSDRGCDGSCVVNNDMYKAVMDAIEKRIQSTTKNDLGVEDCVSRAEVLKLMKDNWHTHNGDWAMQESMDDIRALPSVTPQEPRKGHWIGNYQVGFGEWQEYDVKLSDGFVTDNCHCSECGEELLSGDRGMFCPNCGADMREVVDE